MLPQPHIDRLSRAYDLIDLRRFDQALAEIQHVLAHDPHSVEAHICAAAAWRSQDRFPEAERAARTALAFLPDYPPALYILALILWDQDRFSEAEPPFRQAVRDPHPLQPIYLIQFARRLATIKRFEEARELTQRALLLDPSLSEAHRIYGMIFSYQGLLPEAEAAYREALRLNPRNHTALVSLGSVQLALGQPSQAIDSFRQTLHLDPTNSVARSQLVQALKVRSPLYRWGKKWKLAQAHLGFLLARLLLLTVLLLAVLIVKPQEWWLHLVGSGLYVALLVVALQLLWTQVYESAANTRLWFDPLGRQAHDFDPLDAAVVVQALCVLLGLGLGGLLLTAGPVAPDSLRRMLLGLSALLILFHGAMVVGTSWFRATQTQQIRLLDYLVVVAAPYGIVAAGLLDLRWQVPFHLLLGGVPLALLCFFALRRRKPGA